MFFLTLTLVGAAAGFWFSATSTSDFIAHLDRQVHGLTCSFLPGLDAQDVSGTSGCHVTLMSPYSSVLRESIWGGIPISLPAMAVFAFLAFVAATLALVRRTHDVRATGFLALASMLPALTSVVMAIISIGQLDALCKVCMGIYVSSAMCLIGALGMWSQAHKQASFAEAPTSQTRMGTLAAAFLVGCAFVGASVVTYAASAPAFAKYVGTCGALESVADPQGVLLPLGNQQSPVQMLEVLDPLCPACRAFERRFSALEASDHGSRKALLFPLDHDCNWMVETTMHPGACAISEAMLCAGDNATQVLDWAFGEQEAIVEAERAKKGAAAKLAADRFPELAGCIGSSKARAHLNRALRWAVANNLPVLTPQLYVNGTRLCDADTDLGLDYMLSHLLDQARPTAP